MILSNKLVLVSVALFFVFDTAYGYSLGGLTAEQEIKEVPESTTTTVHYSKQETKTATAAEIPPGGSPVIEDTSDRFGSSMGVPQALGNSKVLQIIDEARNYMQNKVQVDDFYKPVRSLCRNEHENCAFWASYGECDANPGYMKTKCAPVCQTCEMLQVETRCPMDPTAVDALSNPGDVDQLFQRIITDPQLHQYEPVVHSRPSYVNGDTPETATYGIGPWLLTLENALSQDEANRLIELGGIRGYERSSDVGRKLADGSYDKHVNEGRTSTNAWCVDECYEDPLAKRVMDRIETITQVPEMNSEYLQLLRYEQGQFYQAHNDYIPHQTDRQSGVRILTVYFYLNEVEEGGETNFPNINITVTPKRGRVAIWPSVLDSHPNQKDSRTDHQAMPVKKGIKYGANAWLHQRDFKTPHKNGCS